MNHRERVMTALNHQNPDRAPTDLGGSRTSGLHRETYPQLAAELGVEAEAPGLLDMMQQVVIIPRKIKDALDVDIEALDPEPPAQEPALLEGGRWRDEWGAVRRMPKGGHWYDLEASPLSGAITPRDIVKHKWPDPDDPARYQGLRERAKALRENSDRAICIGLRGSVVHTSQFVRGFEDWFCDMAADQDLIGALLDAVADVLVPAIGKTLDLTADLVDIVFVGDDLGTQQASQVSPAVYRKLIKPRHAKVFAAIRAKAPQAFIALHSCGAVSELLDDLIEIGVQVLNPVQVSAAGMNPRELKDRFGDRLSFWGGVDSQRTLPFGTPDDVRREVRERIRVLGDGGGYICGAVHNIQREVPAANILAMFDEARRFAPHPAGAGSS